MSILHDPFRIATRSTRPFEAPYDRKPSPAEVRYLSYAAIARGVKGLFYYLYGPLAPEGGVADVDYNVDATGSELKKIASEVRILAPWLVDASRDYAPKNSRYPIANATLNGVSNPYDFDIQSFTTRAGERLVMVVNERVKTTDPAALTYHVVIDQATMDPFFRKGQVRVIDLLDGAENTRSNALPGSTLEFDTTIAKGDGRLYQIQSAISADIRIPKDGYNNPVAAPKAIKIRATLKNTGSVDWSPASHHVGIHVYPPDGSARGEITGLNLVSPVPSGGSTLITLSIPTGPGTSITQDGTYELGIDLYEDGSPNKWFSNEQRISVMLTPPGYYPLLVDTFDAVPYSAPSDGLWKWDRSARMKIRASGDFERGPLGAPERNSRKDRLAINGHDGAVSHVGDYWSYYTFEFDIMIDLESQHASARAGWMILASSDAKSGYVLMLNSNDVHSSVLKNTIAVYKLTGTGLPASPFVTRPTGLTIKRGQWYHVKNIVSGSGSTIVATQIRELNPGQPVHDLAPWTDSGLPLFQTGRVGFYLKEPAYENTACNLSPAEQVGRCTGGAQGTVCKADVNCLGGSCTGEADYCYPDLDRGHFDNVAVYGHGTSPTPDPVGGLTSNSPAYPLTLRWNNPVNSGSVSHYRVYRSTDPAFVSPPPTLIGEPAGTSFVVESPGSYYYYRVTAVSDSNIEGAPSTAVYGAAPPAPQAVTQFNATEDHMKSVSLSWSSTANARSYRIYRGIGNFKLDPSTLIATVSGTTYVDSVANTYVSDSQLGLNGFTTYRYAIVPVSAGGAVASPTFSQDVTAPGSNLFSDDFAGSAAKWFVESGSWGVDGGTYRQSDKAVTAISTMSANSPLLTPRMADLSVEFTALISDSGGTPSDPAWAGMTFRKTNLHDQYSNISGGYSGYVVYVRTDGVVGIRTSGGNDAPSGPDRIVASASTGLLPNVARKVRVDVTQYRFRVFVDGTKYLDWTDSWGRSGAGYLDLVTYKADARFDKVNAYFRDGFTSSYVDRFYDGFACIPPTPDNGSYGSPCDPGWTQYSGLWLSEGYAPNGSLNQYVGAGTIGVASYPWRKFGNMLAEFIVSVNDNGGSELNWVAMTIRKNAATDRFGLSPASGYVIYYRVNGEVVLFNSVDGQMASAQTGLRLQATNGTPIERKVWIQASGNNIRVFVGSPIDLSPASGPVINLTDSNSRWSGDGYVDFTTYAVKTKIRNLSITRLAKNWTLVSGSYDSRWLHQLRARECGSRPIMSSCAA